GGGIRRAAGGGVGRLELSLDGDSEVAVGIAVSFTPGASFQGWEGGHLFRGIIRLYESRNEDVVKELPCFAQVYSSALAYQAAVVPPGSPSLVDETEDLEVLSPLMQQHQPPPPPLPQPQLQQAATPAEASRGRKTMQRGGGVPPRSPSGGPCSSAATAAANIAIGGAAVTAVSLDAAGGGGR
ncbi:unnamed protein product, partial [Ectocarpus fasciculatus]